MAFIIQSVDYNFNLRRLERYLVMVHEGGIMPVVLLSKSNFASADELKTIKQSVLSVAADSTVIAFSSINGENIDTIKASLRTSHTYCLLRSSVVGKTTLLNSILGTESFATQAAREKDNKGRHTTTSRELIQLDNEALLIDTLGMRELGNMSVDSDIDETFAKILALAQNCKFNNYSHTNEKGCAILAAITMVSYLNSDLKTTYKCKMKQHLMKYPILKKERKIKTLVN